MMGSLISVVLAGVQVLAASGEPEGSSSPGRPGWLLFVPEMEAFPELTAGTACRVCVSVASCGYRGCCSRNGSASTSRCGHPSRNPKSTTSRALNPSHPNPPPLLVLVRRPQRSRRVCSACRPAHETHTLVQLSR